MLACAGGCGTEESQKGAPTSNKKDLRSPRHLNDSDSQVPFPSHLLAGHQWFRDAGLSGYSSEDTRHARFGTECSSPLLVAQEGSGRSPEKSHVWGGSEARDFSKS